MKNRIITTAIMIGIASFAVATAGMKCDEKVSKKAKASASCCATTTKVSKKSAKNADHCAVSSASECTAEQTAACATTVSNVKKAKAKVSSCCSMKAKDMKSASVETPSTEAVAEAPSTTNK